MFTEFEWLTFTAVATFAFARLLKTYPRIPKLALPLSVLAIGYSATVLRHHFGGDMSWADAATAAWGGLGAGLTAVGFHELAKRFLTPIVGPEVTTLLLGKLPKPAPSGAKK